MKVIATVGLPGSGKGEAASVARDEGVPVVTMGDVVRDACRERGLDPSEHHGQVAKALREEEGLDAIAARTLPPVREHLAAHDTVLVDGVRSDVEVDRFVSAFGNDFVLVSIEAPFELRAERLLERARDDSDLDREAIREREQRERGFGMAAAMDRADVRIENTGSLAAFRQQVRRLLRDGPEALRDADVGEGDE
jgi:dephospho-CoA kinase